MRKIVRIVSKGGDASGTKVFVGDEEIISGITRIEIDPIAPGGGVYARITILAELDIEAAAELLAS